MTDVAEAARVSVQSVYWSFHTKATLLSRAIDYAVMGEEEPRPPEQQPWYVAMVAEPELMPALRHLVTGVGELTRRVAPLDRAARVAADADADAREVIDTHERWRADGNRKVLEQLQLKAALAPGVAFDRATDLLLLFLGVDVYRALVDGRGWSHDGWVEWTISTVGRELFDRGSSTGKGGSNGAE
jgi:AcrR family transcriptional regulator